MTGRAAGPEHAAAASRIRHVLLDADGVLQNAAGGFQAVMEPYLGERAQGFLHRVWQEELPMLAGQGDYLPVLAAVLAEYGVLVSAEDVLAEVCHRIEIIAETAGLVRALRARGYGVHLATNQERHRAAYMRTVLGYDALFDVSCYSCDFGVTKPDPAFFAEATRRITAEPSAILLIDDRQQNVTGARTAGLTAGQWSFEAGHDALTALLASHGIAAL